MARKITPTNVLLNQIELSSSASSILFSDIPQGYGDLVVVAHIDGSTQTELYIRFNENTSITYSSVRMQGSGSVAGYNTHSSTSGMRLVGNGDIVTNFSHTAIIQLNDYSATDKHKNVLSRTGSTIGVDACSGRWQSTTAINSVMLYPAAGTFETNSTFSLYGVYA